MPGTPSPALYFYLPQPERRLVPAIRAFIEGSLNGPERLEAMRPVIATLPGIGATGDVDTVRAEVARWAFRHSLHPQTASG